MSVCVRCAERDSTPIGDLCRACRYYTRGPYSTVHMLQVSVRLPQSLLAELQVEAAEREWSLSDVIRGRLAAR
jgi:hypothetical protein